MIILKHINIHPKKRPPSGGLVWEENKHKANISLLLYSIIHATSPQSTNISCSYYYTESIDWRKLFIHISHLNYFRGNFSETPPMFLLPYEYSPAYFASGPPDDHSYPCCRDQHSVLRASENNRNSATRPRADPNPPFQCRLDLTHSSC
jgi:hypothetical protein